MLPLTPPAVPQFQVKPQSAVNGVTDRYKLDEDNYLDVTDWQKVEFEKIYFFLGGYGTTEGAQGFQGGLAAKAWGGHLAFYFNGDLVTAKGKNAGAPESEDNSLYDDTKVDAKFAVLYGNENLGGIRLDIIFRNDFYHEEQGSQVDTANAPDGTKIDSNTGSLVTTVQWGKNLGAVTPRVMAGFIWPQYTMRSDISGGAKTEEWRGAAAALKLELAFEKLPGFALEDQFTLNFGAKGDSPAGGTHSSGWFRNDLAAYYDITADIMKGLQFLIRPRFGVMVAKKDNESSAGNSAPEFWLGITPEVSAGVRYAINEKFSLYTGVHARIMQVTWLFESEYDDVKDKPQSYQMDPLVFGNNSGGNSIEFAANIVFNPVFSLNASVSTPLLQIGIPGSASGGAFSVGNPFSASSYLEGARLILDFKPQFTPQAGGGR